MWSACVFRADTATSGKTRLAFINRQFLSNDTPMTHKYREILDTFTIHTLPDLDLCVLGALELFADAQLPTFAPDGPDGRILVVGSGNAASVGKLLFEDYDAIHAHESTYQKHLDAVSDISGAVLISASGAKHAVTIAQDLKERQIETRLLTNNPDAPSQEFIEADNVFVFPKNREPYTYNTSTYAGMLFSKTRESPASIQSFIEQKLEPQIPESLSDYDAFFLLLPPKFDGLRGMLLTKFDELFGGRVAGRVFTTEQAKHAKTVVPYDRECFISIGGKNEIFGKPSQRLHIPVPDDTHYGAMMMIAYYIIGQIQKQHAPYFKEHIEEYTEQASELFGQKIKSIVE